MSWRTLLGYCARLHKQSSTGRDARDNDDQMRRPDKQKLKQDRQMEVGVMDILPTFSGL